MKSPPAVIKSEADLPTAWNLGVGNIYLCRQQ